MDKASTEKILSYLVDISNQNYSLTDEKIQEETNSDAQLILTGILNLSDELKYLEEEKVKSLDQLVEKSKLERANKELKEFAYMASHDLKAPLRGIANISQWLYKDYYEKFDDEGKGFLNLIIDKVKKLEKLIEDILNYSKIGRRADVIEEIHLEKVLENVLNSLSPPENFTFEISKLPVISGIETEWHQVFLNLISNAINYNDKEEGEIKISYKLDESRLFINVCDNGPGIAAKYQKKIFEIFQSLNLGNNPNSTGIGLSTVKKIIELNSGDIYVKSDGILGTCFLIELPSRVVVKSN
ncbi:MAG: ATP-binding protein [Cyclobacteriaceae bacterium]|nr:ATP-binding protein [Cyclobacteriaceae bacterium]